MYLLLQATLQNTCYQLVSFSNRVYYLDNQKKKKKKNVSGAVLFQLHTKLFPSLSQIV